LILNEHASSVWRCAHLRAVTPDPGVLDCFNLWRPSMIYAA
jgi:hypothetical protein